MPYIQAIGVYLPRLRLSRRAMADAFGWLTPGAGGGGKGRRTLAYWDEDSVTLSVAAARRVLTEAPEGDMSSLYFCSTTPPFSEPQNAAFVRAALRLPARILTHDIHGTPRASLLALHQALESGAKALIASGDIPTAIPGSAAEARAGDGGAAILTGDKGALRYRGGASLSAPFTERYRAADCPYPQEWEERWVREAGYMDLVHDAITQALDAAALKPGKIDHFVMPSPVPGASRMLASKSQLTNAHITSSLADDCGDTGTAYAFIMLAHALETARPGQKVLVAQFGQGATALIFEVTASEFQDRPLVSSQLQNGVPEDNYMKLLAFRGQVEWDRGLRGRFLVNEALSTSWRNSDALLGFIGGRCRETGRVQFPPTRLTVGEGFHLDTQDPIPLADLQGCIATFTADRLAFSPSPPNCYGMVDLDNGARLLMEFTDPEARHLTQGSTVRFSFRIKDQDPQTGYRRYFWKAIAAEQPL